MNKDEMRGVEQDAGGEALEQAGKPAGSKKQPVKGHSKQVSRKSHKSVSDAKQSVEDIRKSYP